MKTVALLADAVLVHGWNFVDIVIWAIVIAAIVAIAWVAFKVFGVSPPAWAIQIFWIVVVAAVAILAIRIVAGM